MQLLRIKYYDCPISSSSTRFFVFDFSAIISNLLVCFQVQESVKVYRDHPI